MDAISQLLPFPVTQYSSFKSNLEINPLSKWHEYLPSKENFSKETTILKEKKLEIIQTAQSSELENSDLISFQFKNSIDKSYITQHNTYLKQCYENVKKETNNAFLRYQLVEACLISAEIKRLLKNLSKDPSNSKKHEANELTYVGHAKRESDDAKIIDYFNVISHYTDCLIMEYDRVDCKQIDQVKKYMHLLKLCYELDPNNQQVKDKLEENIYFLKNRWMELKESTVIDSSTYDQWISQLDRVLIEDPLKILFKKDPNLFKLAFKAKYSSFFKKHPEFKSLNAFLEKFPNEGNIDLLDVLNGRINKLSVGKVLSENGPFTRNLEIISEYDILTPPTTLVIKEEMLKNPGLNIYLGNTDDLTTLMCSFVDETSLNTRNELATFKLNFANNNQNTQSCLDKTVVDTGILIVECLLNDSPLPIYKVFINPEKRLIKI